MIKSGRIYWLGGLVVCGAAALAQAEASGWTADASKAAIPPTQAHGKVAGKEFTVKVGELKQNTKVTVNGKAFKQYHLDLRSEESIFPDSGAEFIFVLPADRKLDGAVVMKVPGDKQPGTIAGNKPVYSMRTNWNRENDSDRYDDDHGTLKLQFGPRKGDTQPGSVYACFSDDRKSFVAGKFLAKWQ